MEQNLKEIPGFNGRYYVSIYGNVISVSKKNGIVIMKPHVDSRGYMSYTFFDGIKTVSISAHRVIATAFIPNPENKREVNHKNGIKTDNRLENLEWATSSENTIHAYANNLIKVNYGEDCHNHKIKEADVLEIRKRLANGETKTEVAKSYNVHRVHIGAIGNRKYWKHI